MLHLDKLDKCAKFEMQFSTYCSQFYIFRPKMFNPFQYTLHLASKTIWVFGIRLGCICFGRHNFLHSFVLRLMLWEQIFFLKMSCNKTHSSSLEQFTFFGCIAFHTIDCYTHYGSKGASGGPGPPLLKLSQVKTAVALDFQSWVPPYPSSGSASEIYLLYKAEI